MGITIMKPWSGRRLQVGQVRVTGGRVHWKLKQATDHMSFGPYDARKLGEYLIKAANHLEFPDDYPNPDEGQS
jgi:hypothetical protein